MSYQQDTVNVTFLACPVVLTVYTDLQATLLCAGSWSYSAGESCTRHNCGSHRDQTRLVRGHVFPSLWQNTASTFVAACLLGLRRDQGYTVICYRINLVDGHGGFSFVLFQFRQSTVCGTVWVVLASLLVSFIGQDGDADEDDCCSRPNQPRGAVGSCLADHAEAVPPWQCSGYMAQQAR